MAKREKRIQRNARVWLEEVLPNWGRARTDRRTAKLCFEAPTGCPHAIVQYHFSRYCFC